jgi:hypothetical protein
MPRECLADRAWVVAHFVGKQSFVNEPVDLRFAQQDRHAAKALPPTLPVKAHAFGGCAWVAKERVHQLLFQSLLRLFFAIFTGVRISCKLNYRRRTRSARRARAAAAHGRASDGSCPSALRANPQTTVQCVRPCMMRDVKILTRKICCCDFVFLYRGLESDIGILLYFAG